MADHCAGLERVAVIALQEVCAVAAFDPVVAGIAKHHIGAGTSPHEVIALTREGLGITVTAEDDVFAVTTKQQIKARAVADDVVAACTLDLVVAEQVGQDVIALTAEHEVIACTALQTVIATVAIQGVVTRAGAHVVGTVCATHDDVLAASKSHLAAKTGQQRLIDRSRCVVNDCTACVDRAHLEGVVGRGEHIAREVFGAGVAHHQFGHRALLELQQHVQAGGARQIIEAVIVLQRQHLGGEHIVEGRAQHAAKGLSGFGQATDPEIDVIQTAEFAASELARCIHEVDGTIGVVTGCVLIEQCLSGRTFACQRVCCGDRAVRAVGCNEVDHRLRMLDRPCKVGPALVGLKDRQAGVAEEHFTRCIQARGAGIAAAGNVERCQVKWQTQQVALQRLGHELVDRVAALMNHAVDDRAGGFVFVGTAGHELERVQEGLDQPDRVGLAGGGVNPVDGVGQHRVAKAVHHVSELGHDRRVDRGVVAGKQVD